MTMDEFSKIAKGMKAVYAYADFLPDEDALNMWFALLGDLPYKVAAAAVKQYMLTNKRTPTVAHIREIATEIMYGASPDYGDGWEQVQRAIRRYGYYNEAAALDSLDPLTRKCVERLGFRNLCTSENPVADRANFRNIFEQYAQRERREQQLPDSLKLMIGDLSAQKLLE